MAKAGNKTQDWQASGNISGLQVLELEDFLPYQLNIAASTVSEGLARVYSARFGLDIPGWRVIATLGQVGESTAKAIGNHSRMHKTKVSRAVSDLEQRGLIVRMINPDDKREAFLALTLSGMQTYGDIVPLAKAYEKRLLSGFSPADKALFKRMLARLSA